MENNLWFGFLRGINVSGYNKIAMQELKELLNNMELGEPQTLLNSGNVIFKSQIQESIELEARIEEALDRRFGMKISTFVRTGTQLKQIIEENPFPKEADVAPNHLLILFLKGNPSTPQVVELQSSIKGREIIKVVNHHAYLIYPDGIGDSKLTTAMLERKLGCQGTARNWNTILKLGQFF